MRRRIDKHAAALAAVVTNEVHIGIHVHLHVVVDGVGGGGRRRLGRRHQVVVRVYRQRHIRRPRLPRR